MKVFFNSLGGKITTAVVTLLVLASMSYVIYTSLGDSRAVASVNQRMFVDSESLKAFPVTLTPGMNFPLESPYSGKKTGFPAEACYWTKDGKIKNDPTYVILNNALGKAEPTFCPDCGRLVHAFSHKPSPDETAPPTKEDYGKSN